MLDKTIPYHDLIMHRRAGTPLPAAIWPDGYSLVGFAAGDEHAWAEIESAVLEFDSQAEALTYFGKEYLPFLPELQRRTFFVQAPDGRKVGTVTIWWEYSGKRRVAALHWVGIHPDCQGLGLGKAMVNQAMQEFLDIEGDEDLYLHTQTWSYRAIGIYLQAGFRLLPSGTYAHHINQYEQALPILQRKLTAGSLAGLDPR